LLAIFVLIGQIEYNGLRRIGLIEYVIVGWYGQRVVLVLLFGYGLQQSVNCELVLSIAQHGHPLVLLFGRISNYDYVFLFHVIASFVGIEIILVIEDLQFEKVLVFMVLQMTLVQRDLLFELEYLL
jgi:hypothetical protein